MGYLLSIFAGFSLCEAQEKVRILRVYDGDTVVIRRESGEKETLRYEGMDTPELHHPRHPVEEGALKALQRNAELVEGKCLELTHSFQSRDRYGRLLGSLWVSSEGGKAPVQEILLEEGLGVLRYGAPKDPCFPRFSRAFKRAIQHRRGFWKAASERIFTPLQVWAFVPYLQGRFITLRCIPTAWVEGKSQITLTTEAPRVMLRFTPSQVEENLKNRLRRSLGKSLEARGKVVTTYKGVVLSIHHEAQITGPWEEQKEIQGK